MNWETAIGLAFVFINAAVAAMLADHNVNLNGYVEMAFAGIVAGSGALLLYIRPAMRGGTLVDPPLVVTPPAPVVQAQTATVVTAPPQKSEYPN